MRTRLNYVLVTWILVSLGFLLYFFLFLTPVVKSEPPPDTLNIFPPHTSKVFASESSISVTVSVTNLVTGDESLLPGRFSLSQNYPNPFNSSTIIQYTLPEPVWVKLEVYNVLGQKVAILVDATQPIGYYRIVWEGTNSQGKTVASGVYLYRITAGEFTKAKKMMLLE